MYIHKWLLYLLIILSLFLVFVLPNLLFALSAQQASGTIVEVIEEEVTGRVHSYIQRYPVFEYKVNGKTYHCIAQPYAYERAVVGFKTPISYDPDDPADGRVNNFYGTWGRTFVWLFPTYLVITLCFLAINFIPTRIRIPTAQQIDKKLFEEEAGNR